MNIDELKRLAGVCGSPNSGPDNSLGSNISLTGQEKADLMRKHDIKPGTDAWFRLWFSKPYLTSELPMGKE